MDGIHPSAVVDPAAKIGNNVKIGPFSVVSANTVIGDDVVIDSHVAIMPYTEIGERTHIHKGAVVGDEAQDISYDGAEAWTKIGSDCEIREYVTIHRSNKEGGTTIVGNDVMLMAFSHVAHDCNIGNNVVVANNTQIAGHTEIEDKAILSANIMIHQFTRIGTMAMISGGAVIRQDIPPYVMISDKTYLMGPNAIGLKRNGFTPEERKAVREAVKKFFFSDMARKDALEEVEKDYSHLEKVMHFVNHIRDSKRGVITAHEKRAAQN